MIRSTGLLLLATYVLYVMVVFVDALFQAYMMRRRGHQPIGGSRSSWILFRVRIALLAPLFLSLAGVLWCWERLVAARTRRPPRAPRNWTNWPRH